MSIKARLAQAGVTGVLALAGTLTYFHEGDVRSVYFDPTGTLTVCSGHTRSKLELGQVFSEADCTDKFIQDLKVAQADVKACIKTPLPERTEAALVSFTFWAGRTHLCSSTLAQKANQGDLVGACQELPRWVYSKGQVLPGLVTRRKAELKLCLEGVVP